MSTTQRVHRDPAVPDPAAKFEPGEMAALFTSGVEKMAEVQKKTIEAAVQQHDGFVDLWKKAMRKVPAAPGLFLLELESSGFERFAEIQKSAIDLAVEQSRAFAGLLKERTTAAGKATEETEDFARKSAERVVAMQKKALEQSAAQAKAVMEKSNRQFGVEGNPAESAADSIRRGVEAIVDAQKDLLDMAVR